MAFPQPPDQFRIIQEHAEEVQNKKTKRDLEDNNLNDEYDTQLRTIAASSFQSKKNFMDTFQLAKGLVASDCAKSKQLATENFLKALQERKKQLDKELELCTTIRGEKDASLDRMKLAKLAELNEKEKQEKENAAKAMEAKKKILNKERKEEDDREKQKWWDTLHQNSANWAALSDKSVMPAIEQDKGTKVDSNLSHLAIQSTGNTPEPSHAAVKNRGASLASKVQLSAQTDRAATPATSSRKHDRIITPPGANREPRADEGESSKRARVSEQQPHTPTVPRSTGGLRNIDAPGAESQLGPVSPLGTPSNLLSESPSPITSNALKVVPRPCKIKIVPSGLLLRRLGASQPSQHPVNLSSSQASASNEVNRGNQPKPAAASEQSPPTSLKPSSVASASERLSSLPAKPPTPLKPSSVASASERPSFLPAKPPPSKFSKNEKLTKYKN